MQCVLKSREELCWAEWGTWSWISKEAEAAANLMRQWYPCKPPAIVDYEMYGGERRAYSTQKLGFRMCRGIWLLS